METGKEVAIKIIENLAENIREVSIEIIIMRKIMSNLVFFGNDDNHWKSDGKHKGRLASKLWWFLFMILILMIVRWCKSTRSSQGTVFIQTSPFYTELSGLAMRSSYDGADEDEDKDDSDDDNYSAQVWSAHLAFDGTLWFRLSGWS